MKLYTDEENVEYLRKCILLEQENGNRAIGGGLPQAICQYIDNMKYVLEVEEKRFNEVMDELTTLTTKNAVLKNELEMAYHGQKVLQKLNEEIAEERNNLQTDLKVARAQRDQFELGFEAAAIELDQTKERWKLAVDDCVRLSEENDKLREERDSVSSRKNIQLANAWVEIDALKAELAEAKVEKYRQLEVIMERDATVITLKAELEEARTNFERIDNAIQYARKPLDIKHDRVLEEAANLAKAMHQSRERSQNLPHQVELSGKRETLLPLSLLDKKLILLKKVYDGESLVDMDCDVAEAIDCDFNKILKNIPQDEYGFQQGTFTVTIEWGLK